MIDNINANSSSILETILTESANVGYTISDSMNTIWTSADSVITMYGEGFINSITGVKNAVDAVNASVNSMIGALNNIATQKIQDDKTKPSSKLPEISSPKEPEKKPTSKPASKPSTSTPKFNDDIKKGVATAIYIIGSKSGWGNDPVRKKRLTEKFGATNAAAIQTYINQHHNELYSYWVSKGKSNMSKYYYNAFKSGARTIDKDQLAWTQENEPEVIIRPSDGAILTPLAKNDSVLNAKATGNIFDMANSPTKFIKDNLGIVNSSVPNNSSTNNNIVQNLDNVTFNFPNVRNYNEMLAQMQKDRNFERLINSMTVDRLAGKSSLAKNKAIR